MYLLECECVNVRLKALRGRKKATVYDWVSELCGKKAL